MNRLQDKARGLFLLVALISWLVVLLAIFRNFNLIKSQAIDAKTQEMRYLVAGLRDIQDNLITEARSSLMVLNEYQGLDIEGSPKCDETMVKMMKLFPDFYNFGLMNLEGKIVCSGVPHKDVIYSADRVFFQKALENDSFSVGEYQIGRITKKQSLNFGYPYKTPTGKLMGVIFVAQNLNWVADFVQSQSLSKDVTVFVIDRKGILLSDANAGGETGKFGLNAELISLIMSNKETAVFSGNDHIERTFAFVKEGTQDRPDIVIAAGAETKPVVRNVVYLFFKDMVFLMGMFVFLNLVGLYLLRDWFNSPNKR